MILTRTEIKKLIDKNLLDFDPKLDKFQDQPHAVDLRLGTVFYIPKIWELTSQGREILTVDVTQPGDNYEKIELKPGQFFDLAPGESIIASSFEKIALKTPDIMGVLYPRSSVNRRGLSVDMTGIIDALYSGHLMIPILNKTHSQIIRLYPGERICQVVFQKLTGALSPQEALRHGATQSKYNDADSHKLLSKADDKKETELIKSGNLEALKKII